MQLLEETIQLIEAVETNLVGDTYSNIRPIKWFKKCILLPTKFMAIGGKEKFDSMFIWCFISLLIIELGKRLLADSGMPPSQIANAVTFVAMIIPTFIVIFAVPSMYAHRVVSQKNIDFVEKYLAQRGLAKIEGINLLI